MPARDPQHSQPLLLPFLLHPSHHRPPGCLLRGVQVTIVELDLLTTERDIFDFVSDFQVLFNAITALFGLSVLTMLTAIILIVYVGEASSLCAGLTRTRGRVCVCEG